MIILQNRDDLSTVISNNDIRKILYNQPYKKQVRVDSILLKQYAGIYLSDNKKEYNILFEDEILVFQVNPDLKLRLIPVSDSEFILDRAEPKTVFIFIRNAKGEVDKFRFSQPDDGIDKES